MPYDAAERGRRFLSSCLNFQQCGSRGALNCAPLTRAILPAGNRRENAGAEPYVCKPRHKTPREPDARNQCPCGAWLSSGIRSMHMNSKTLLTVMLFLICLVLFSCTRKTSEDVIADNAEVKTFVTYFFVPGSTLLKNATDVFLLQNQYAQSLVSTDDICFSDSPCNKTKDYFLKFTPNFLFEIINGRKIVTGADPDAFVDLRDIKGKKSYRVRATGTEGSIYGTFWLSDFSFVVYGIESDEAFVDVYDIKAKTKTSYTIDKTKRKPDADVDAFLIAKYGQVDSFQSER